MLKSIFENIHIAKEGIWIIIGQAISILGSLFIVRILTDHLDTFQYGQLALALTSVGFINQVVMGGIVGGVSRFYSVSLSRDELFSYFKDVKLLVLYETIFIAIIGLIALFELRKFGSPSLVILGFSALLYALIGGYNALLSGLQTAARKRSAVAINSGAEVWLRILFSLIFILWLGPTSIMALYGFIVASILIVFSQIYNLKKIIPIKSSVNKKNYNYKSEIWKYAWPFSIWGIFSWTQQASIRWAIEFFGAISDVGLFQALSQIGYAPIQIATGLIVQLITPILFSKIGDGSCLESKKQSKKIMVKLAYFGIMATVIFSLIAHMFHSEIFGYLVGRQYRQISYLMPWIVVAGGVIGVSQILSAQLLGEFRVKELMLVSVITGILGTILNIGLIYTHGINGAIAALCIYSVMNFIWIMIILIRKS